MDAAFVFQQVIQEEGVPLEIAHGKAAGFAGEAVGPCEACALHPSWGVGFGAGVDIEGKAYCEKDTAGEEWLEPSEEVVLLRSAETDPDEVRAQGLKFLDDFGIIFQSAFGGAVSVVGANNVQLRIFFEQAFAEFFSAFWTAAEEVVRELGGAGGEEFSQEGGAVNAVLKRSALAVQAPDEGHSIWDEEVDAGCGGGECGVVPPHGDYVGVGKIDGVGARLTAAGQKMRAKGLVIGAGEVGGEDAASFGIGVGRHGASFGIISTHAAAFGCSFCEWPLHGGRLGWWRFQHAVF